jgi:hypothetical protein
MIVALKGNIKMELVYKLEEKFGKLKRVIHPLKTDDMHVHIGIFGKTDIRPYYTVATIGLSGIDMEIPPGRDAYPKNIEIFLRIPDLSVTEFDTEFPWYIDLMREVAHFVSEEDVYIEPYICLPNGSPLQPFIEGCNLTCTIIYPAYFENETVQNGMDFDGKKIHFYWIDFITTKEYEFIKSNGIGMFMNVLKENNHKSTLQEYRESYV